MSGSRLDRFVAASDALRATMQYQPGGHSRTLRIAYDDARARLLDTKTDETGPVHAVSAERAAELAPDTRPSVAPGDPVAAARADGYARCQADVVALLYGLAAWNGQNAEPYRIIATRIGQDNEHVGAAARAKGGG